MEISKKNLDSRASACSEKKKGSSVDEVLYSPLTVVKSFI
jgi:hypothetical protein